MPTESREHAASPLVLLATVCLCVSFGSLAIEALAHHHSAKAITLAMMAVVSACAGSTCFICEYIRGRHSANLPTHHIHSAGATLP